MSENKNDIIIELESISPFISSIPRNNVFRVPDNYFDSLATHILLNINKDFLLKFPANDIKRQVPEGYFDSLAENIISRIKQKSLEAGEEIKQLSPALSVTGNDNVFTVPMGYFETLSDNILERVKPVARVVVMRKRTNLLKYAVAAVLTGILGLSLFNLINNKVGIETQVSPVSSQLVLNNNSFNDMLATIDSDEIIQYLEENGEDVEAALLASATDTRNLPDASEYFINDKTLDLLLIDLNLDPINN